MNVFRFFDEGLFGEIIQYNALRISVVFPTVSSVHLKKQTKTAKNV